MTSMKQRAHSSLASALIAAMAVTMLGACTRIDKSASASKDGVTTVTIALETNDKPYSYEDEQGNPAGFDLDVLKALDDRLGQYRFEYTTQDYETALVGVKQGKYDALIGAFFATPARAEQYLLSEPYNYYFMNLIVPEGSGIKTLKDLDGKSVAPIVPTDGRYIALRDWLSRNPGTSIDVPTTSNQDTFANMVRQVHDGTYAAVYLSREQYDGVAPSLDFTMKVTDEVDGAGTVILYNRNEGGALKKAIDGAIASAMQDGTLSKLSERWFKQDNYAKAEQLGLVD